MFYELFIIFILLFLSAHAVGIVENYTNPKKIILLGDSIFKNDSYVLSGYSVEDYIKEHNRDVINLAKDNAKIDSVYNQIKNIPDKDITQYVIFISIGGNDIIHKYEYEDKRDNKELDIIFNKYTKLIDHISNTYKTTIILTNLYHPFVYNYKDYYPLIDKWNNIQKKYANTKKLKVMDIDSAINDPKNLVKDIEPSKSGGKIISKIILDSV